MSQKKSPLTHLASLLEDQEFNTHLEGINAGHPVEQLFVSLGQDEQGRSYTVTLHYVNDITNAAGGTDSQEDAIILQLFIPLPYICQTQYLDQVARMVLLVNRLLPLGAFGITDPEGMAYLQYNLAMVDRSADIKVMCEILGMMAFICNEFGPKIEAVGMGQLSCTTYVEQLASSGIELPGLAPTLPKA